jgi:hypothetical protein
VGGGGLFNFTYPIRMNSYLRKNGECVRRGLGQVDARQVNVMQANARSRLVRQADEMQAKERNEK